MEQVMAQIPPTFYIAVGVLILSNLSAIGALIVFIFKCGMFVADTKAGIKDAKATAVRAHNRIDILEEPLRRS